MNPKFDTVIDRYRTGSVKFDTAVAQGYPGDVLPLWVADMDFQAPACVRQALQQRVEHGIFGYSLPMDSYFEAVSAWFAKYFDWQLEKDWLVCTPGVVFALSAAVRVTTQPGDSVLVLPPVYYPFYNVINQNDRKVVASQLVYADGRYSIDFEDFEAKILQENVKLFILCSPHNPVCRVWSREELQRLGRICKAHNVKVIADEIHCDFTLPGHIHIPFPLACPQLAEDTIVCTAPSKTFNLAGLQVSNLFIPGQQLRQAYQQELLRISCSGLNCLGLVACQAAYEGGRQWLEECKAYMLENLNYVRDFLQTRLPQIRLVEPEGTYFAWLDCTGLDMTAPQLDAVIIHLCKLWLDTGAIFGQCADRFQRVVLACPRATLEKAMAQLEAGIARWQAMTPPEREEFMARVNKDKEQP